MKDDASIRATIKALPQPAAGSEKLPGIRHIVAVGSGKAVPR
jgi:hypothetical protein